MRLPTFVALVLGATLFGCGTRTVEPITSSHLRPALSHLVRAGARPPDAQGPGLVPVWGRPSPDGAHAIAGVLGASSPLVDIDLTTGKIAPRSPQMIEPLEGAPSSWFVAGSTSGALRNTIYQLGPSDKEPLAIATVEGPFRVLFDPHASYAVVADLQTPSTMRLRSLRIETGAPGFSVKLPSAAKLVATSSFSVAALPTAILRQSLATGDSVELPGEWSDVIELQSVTAREALLVRPSGVETLDLDRMRITARYAAPNVAFAVVSGGPTRAVAMVSTTKRLTIVRDDGARGEVDLPCVARPMPVKQGVVITDGRRATLVGWDGVSRWTKDLPKVTQLGELEPRVVFAHDLLIVATEDALAALDIATGAVRYAYRVRGASPGITALTHVEDFSGAIDAEAAAAREARLGSLLGTATSLKSTLSTKSAQGFAMGASAFASQSLLEAQARAVASTESKREHYKAAHDLSARLEVVSATHTLQGKYFVRRLRWFWGEGVLVVRLADGAWREVITSPPTRLGEPWGCVVGAPFVAGDRLVTLGMPMKNARQGLPSSTQPAPCPLLHLQVWDLFYGLRDAAKYPRESVVQDL